MGKPSIAELLNASGHTTYTQALVMRAMYTLYGNIGANLDERNWSALMQSSNPLETAEAGLLGMYQDSGYLLRNTQHLVQSGYVAAQAEITYRQMADRLGFSYSPEWSVGTSYESLGQLSVGQLIALVPVTPVAPPPPLPTISVASSATGFTVSLNVAGTVKMSASGDLASFAAGATVLTEQATIKEGFLTLSSSGNTSTATSQYVVLGTGGDESINTSAAGNRVDYIFGGAGSDDITGGGGADVLYGGTGDDRFWVNAGNEVVAGEIYDGGEGFDTLFVSADANFTGVTTINAIERIVLGDDVDVVFDAATLTGQTIAIDGTGNTVNLETVTINGTDSAETINMGGITPNAGTVKGLTISGLGGDDTIIGSAGNDTITGGTGADTLSGGNGDDVFEYTDNVQLREDSSVIGGDGFDTIAFSVAIDTLSNGSAQGDNFHADFSRVTGVERIKLFGASLINLGDVLPGAGITTIATGDDSTTLRYDNIVLGTLNVDATALADNKTLTLTQAGPAGAGEWFSVTELKGDVNAAGLQGGVAVTAATGSGFDVSIVGGNGNDTLTGGAGNDTINGGDGADRITGDTGADILTGGAGADTFVLTTGAGANLFAGSLATTASMDRITDFVAGTDKIALVNGTPVTSVVMTSVTVATAADVATLLTAIGTQVAASAAATEQQVGLITVIAGAMAGTYLLINDTANVATATDSLISVTGVSGIVTAADFVFA